MATKSDNGRVEQRNQQVGASLPEAGAAKPVLCETCKIEVVTIHMTVDGNDLVMESCQRCDTRRWHLAGKRIDLEQALAEVGEHAGRRR